jgi:hypothetical protein
VKGKERKVVDAPVNPFLAGIKVSPGRPSEKQAQNSTEPPKVGPQKNIVSRRMADMRSTKGEPVRQSAAKENSAVFENAGHTSSSLVNKDKQAKQNRANQKLQNKIQNVNNPSGNAAQQAGPKTAPLVAGATHRTEPGVTPSSDNLCRQAIKQVPAPYENNSQYGPKKILVGK